jgi:hypothetical protein
MKLKEFGYSIIVAIGLSILLSGQSWATDTIFYQGPSDRFQVKWTNADIRVTTNGKLVYSALVDMRLAAKYILDDSYACDIQQDVKMLSLVGPYMSLRYHYYADRLGKDGLIAAAHPAGASAYLSVNLNDPGHPILNFVQENKNTRPEITDLFPAEHVLGALAKDQIISKTFDKTNLKHLSSFRQALQEYLAIQPDSKYCGTFEPRFLSAFCLHHVEGNNIAVRFGVSGAGPCRENLTEIGICLSIPKTLSGYISNASTGKEGFLTPYVEAHNKNALSIYNVMLKNNNR